MRNKESLPVFVNMGTSITDDRKRVVRSYYCKFTSVTKTLVKQAYETRSSGEVVRRTSLISRTPARPFSTGLHTMDEKRAEAEERNKYCASLSIQDRIERLDRRFGKGQGARKERARLIDAQHSNALNPQKMHSVPNQGSGKATNVAPATAVGQKLSQEEKAARRSATAQAKAALRHQQ